MIAEAIRDYLAGVAGVTARLATYEFTTDAAPDPAIFTIPLPEDAQIGDNQCAIVIEEITGSAWGVRAQHGGMTLSDVNVWAKKSRSEVYLRNTVQLVWEALDRAELPISGYGCFVTVADAPVKIRDPEGFPGYRIVVRCEYLQSS